MKYLVPILGAFCLVASISSAATLSAEEAISRAKSKASAEKKAIFVQFGASWCPWCKLLDTFLERPDIKPLFEKYFVPVKLVVQEIGTNKVLENPGADALLKDLGGPAGLPYSAFLDAKGVLIVNSKLHGENIGYPALPQEIAHFMQMMKQAAPGMSDLELKVIEKVLRNLSFGVIPEL